MQVAIRRLEVQCTQQLRCASGGRTSRKLRQSQSSEKVELPPLPRLPSVGSKEPPPGLRRLQLEQAKLDAILETGRALGPSAAHASLLHHGTLESEKAQVACAAALNTLWESLRAYRDERSIWEAAHAAWRLEHAAWKAEAAERKTAKKAEVETGAEDLPPAPAEPPEPVLQTYGCYVWGSVGSGKSLLTDLFVDCCGGSGSPLSLAWHRVHFHEFMLEVHQELHQLRRAGREKTTQAVARRIASEVQVLAFDEFQITNIADALIVETLFDALFQRGVAVVMTSNRPPEDLYKDGLNRHLAIPQFLALLERRNVAFVEVSSVRDFRSALAEPVRGENGWRDFIYKAEAGSSVEERLRSAFAEAAGEAGKPATVPVAWGRTVAVKEASSYVGRFSFDQLCVDPLNADDYLHLANRFHTLVVTDVPHFSLEQHNEARRFTNLVDCVYERHARLIISADAPPEQLLESMAALSAVSLSHADGPASPGLASSSSSDWVRNNPFSPEPSTVDNVMRSAKSIGAGAVEAGDDDTATGAGVAGVMAGALGSLQESGFAAKRATSRLLHMQTQDYLLTHQRNRIE